MIKSGISKRNLLLLAAIASLSTTMIMNAAYADNLTPTRGANAAYTITNGTVDNYNFITSDGSTTSYYKTNLSTLNLLNNINGSTAWLEGTQDNNNFSVVLPNNETRYFIHGYTKPDGWGDGEIQRYDINGNAAGNSTFYNNRTFNGLNSTVSGGAIYIQGNYQAEAGHGSNLVGTMTADFINNSITNTDTSEKGLGGALHIWGPYAGIETLNSNFINNHITYGTAKSGGGALAIGEGYNGGESTVGLINGNFINNYIEAPSNNFGGAIYYEGSGYGDGEITSIGQDPVHTTKFVGNHILGTGQGGAIYAVNKIGSIYADFIGNYIAGSSDASRGGAISLNKTSDEKNVGSITGDFIGNYITTSANNGTAYGGAIYNSNSVGSITGDFIGNYVVSEQDATYGGAVYNTGTITNLTGNFIGNYANGKAVYGGAIHNKGTITNLNGKFIENDVYSNAPLGFQTDGGAIANTDNGIIENISGDFIRNKAHTYDTSRTSMMVSGGAIYNDGAKIGTINANFIENESQREAGAIYNSGNSSNNNGIGTISGNFIKNKVTGEIARDTNGGAISNAGTIDSITAANFINNTVNSANGRSGYGGAIYNNYMIGEDNGYGFVDSSTGIIDSSFTGNTASTAGGAIYNTSDAKGINIIANTKNVEFSGNIAPTGASIYNLSADGTNITATGGNVTFTNNTPTNSQGYGIYSSASVNLAANDGYTVKIDDSIDIVNQYADLTINQGNFTGNVELNGKINFENSNSGIRVGFAGFDSGTLKLGATPANGTYQYLVNAGNYTLDLQNEHAGDNLILSQLSGIGEMKFNIDYDATANSMDKITVNAGSGTITLNAVNVINDNANFVDGTTAEYLDGTARGNITVISDAINSATDTGWLYVFTPTSTNGKLSIARTIAYDGDLINAIQDNLGGTYHPTSFSLSDNFTANRNFGALNTENREQFTIFGNNHTISGDNNTYTGIEVASGQTLNLDSVRFSNVKDYDVQNAGTLNLSGTNTINTIAGATGNTNITGGTTTISQNGSATQKVINISDGELIADYGTTITATEGVKLQGGTLKAQNGATVNNIIADEHYTGNRLVVLGGGFSSLEGTFKGSNTYRALDYNSATALTIDGVTFDSNAAGAIYHSWSGTVDSSISNSTFTNNSNEYDGGAYYQFSTNGSDHTVSFNNVTFTSNSATNKGGAILAGLNAVNKLNISNSTFTSNTVTSANGIGSAIYLQGIAGAENTPSSFTIDNSTFTSNGAGGVVYANGGNLTVKNSTFTSNSGDAIVLADNYQYWTIIGGQITAVYSPITANIVAETGNVSITGNSGWGIVGNNNHETESALTLYAKSGNITINGNTAGGINNNGLALTLNADTGHNITINDTVSSTTGMTVNADNNAGTVALNGDLENAGTISVGGGTLELGSTAVTSLANAIETNNGTVKLTGGTLTQAIAGATTITGTVIDNNATLGNVTITNTANFTDNGGTFTTADNAGILNLNGVSLGNGKSVNNTATLNLTGDNYIKTITGSTGTTNIIDGTTEIAPNGSVTQNAVNLQGGRLDTRSATVNKIVASEDYSSNYSPSNSEAKGGAIYNYNSTLSSIEGTFKGNSVTAASSTAQGGAIHNNSAVLNLSDLSFINNSATASSGNAYGGAIYGVNSDLTITNSTFTGNTVTGSTGSKGSAVYFDGRKYSSYNDQLNITNSTFSENGAGGVLFVNGGTVNVTDSSFTNNLGDAISLNASSSFGIVEGVLTQINKSIVANIIADTEDISISDNSGTGIKLTGNAAGISALTLYAKNHDILIKNNTSGGIITQGASNILTLNADTDHSVTINDYIASNTGMTINSNNNAGTVALNGALTLGGDTNIQGGTLKLGTGAATSNLKNVVFSNTSTLDLQNSSAQTTTVDSIKLNDLATANLNIDINFTGTSVVADAINITTGGQTGVITLDSIAALSSDEDIKEFSNLAILTGETSGVTLALSTALQNDTRFNIDDGAEVTYTSDYNDNVTFGQFTGDKFTTTEWTETFKKKLTVDEETNTKLSFTKTSNDDKHSTGTTQQDVLQALNQSTNPERKLSTDSASAVYTVGDNLGTTGAGTLTVEGVLGSELNLNGKTGFELTNAGTVLNLKNLTITALADETTSLLGIANKTGTKANLENITVSQAITKDVITNLGELNFSGTNTINSYIGGTGTTNINGGKTTLAKLVQNVVNITAGELEVANITATNEISNDGTLTLTGTANANTISGTGHTTIAGNVNNTGAINQAITVNGSKTLTTAANLIGGAVTNGGTVELTSGTLGQTITGGNITISTGEVTAAVDKLGGNITNNSTLLLSGTLDKAIAGASGITKIDSNLKMTSTGSIECTLALNGCNLDLSGDGAATQYNVNTLDESGHLKIDIDYSGTTPIADSINIATTGGAGSVQLIDITEIGTAPGSFTVEVLKGNIGAKTLEISDSLAEKYRGVEETTITYESDDYSANINFDKTTFDTREYTEKTQKTLSVVDNTKLKLDKVVTKAKHKTGVVSKDALAFINQNTDTSAVLNRSMVTSVADKTYTVQENLGTTGAGTLLVQGATDKTTKLDMNNHSGFVVSNSGTTVTLKDINVNNVQNSDGALVNISNTVSSATLDGATVNVKDNPENKANVISSNGSVTVKDSTVNAGINNTGTLNFEGTSKADKVSGSTGTTNVKGQTTIGSIVQKLVDIVTGGKLIANGDVTTGTGTGEGIKNAVAEGLEINNGKLTGNVTGSGSTDFKGNSAIADGSKVNQGVNVADGKLTTSASSLGGAVTNSGEVDLTGGTLETSITSGNTTISGNVGVDDTLGSIASAVKIATSGKLSTNASNVTGAINNGGNLDLTGGDIKNAISGDGNTTISGTVTNTTGSAIGNAVTIASAGNLTTAADKLGGAVTNSGTVNLNDGALSQTITGGILNIAGDVTTSADNLKADTTTVTASKDLTLNGGNLTKDITGSGNTKIAGTVTNSANIQTATEITSGSLDNTNGQLADVTVTSGSLKSNADNVGAVVNNGTYEITGGTIASGNGISGTGNINITGNVINNATNTTTGAVSVAAGKELAIGTSGDTFSTASSVTMGNNSTLNLQNGSTTNAVMDNLIIATGENVNVKMDWKDTLNSSSSNIDGGLTVTDINMASSTSSYEATSYTFTNLGEKIALSNPVNLSGVTDSTNNFVSYNSATGNLTSFRNSLLRAVDKTEAGQTATYVMTGDETAGGQELDGALKVQGDGHTINTAGIKVGSSTITNADLTLENTNMNVSGKALKIFGGNKATVDANGHDITLTTTDNSEVVSLNKGTATFANAEFKGANTINITGDIVSDDINNVLTIAAGATVNHAGLLDPLTTEVNGTYNRTSGYDETVTYNVNAGGSLNFTNDTTLYDASHHTTAMLNTINFNGGSVNTINNVVTDFQLANMSLTGTSNFYADVDLANQTMDKFTVNNPVTGTGKLNVAGLNLISDAIADNTTINFTTDPILMAATSYTGSQGLTALSPIYKYNVGYDNTTGNFNFARFSSGGHSDFNPAILPTPIAAQLGGYLIQLNSYDEAFRNMDMYMLMTKDQRQAMKLKNKYADLNAAPVYDDTKAISENAAGWFRPFVNFESVGLKNGPKVKNNIYGTFAGFDSGITELGNGWDGMWGIYAGYNGSHQHYDGIGIYQNGGTLGLTGMLYKDNFFTGLTANVGANAANASTMYGNEDFAMLMTGAALKTGYNWELAEGKFIIQPNYQMSYSMVNTFDYTNSAGVRVKSDPLHAITFEPGVKFIGNLPNGWQPYAGVSVVWNVLDKTDVKANDVSLPNMSVKPFVKYGVGVRKTWGERLTGFIQTFITNGGRNGIGFQAGFKWFLGKENPSKAKKSQNKMPEKEQTKITLKNIK